MYVIQEGVKEKPKCRVELHIHLDGAVRLETAWELLRQKGLPLPGDGSLHALAEATTIKRPSGLSAFLAAFHHFAPAFIGDLDAIERISKEFVEDRSRDHTAYCEARFSPHLLLPPSPAKDAKEPPAPTDTPSTLSEAAAPQTNGKAETPPEVRGSPQAERASLAGGGSPMTVNDVVEAVLRGVAEGERTCPGTKVRLILCCIRGKPEWSWEVLRLCERFRRRGVVGIDIAGSHEGGANGGAESWAEGAEVFQAAAAAGIHRTVHAGEDAPAASVTAAVEQLRAERVGHGYRVLEDEAAYASCRQAGVHFEVCPTSSFLTGAVAATTARHPILQFAEDGVSFSINSDDPTVTKTRLEDEYALLRGWGFTEALLVRANFHAALHCFLPLAEKQDLLKQLKHAYGVVDLAPPVDVAASTASTASAASKPSKPTTTTPKKPTITVNTWEDRR